MRIFFIGLLLLSSIFNSSQEPSMQPTQRDTFDPNYIQWSFEKHISEPTWGTPIHLLRTPTLLEQIERNNGQHVATMTPEEIAFLKSPRGFELVQAAFAIRQLPRVGHDQARKTSYTGQIEKPDYIVVTHSGTNDLQTYVQQLRNTQLAHNFIIDRDGTIHPVTNENESVQDALKHRLHALGVTRWIDGTGHEICDMNARSMSIAIIGDPSETPITEGQIPYTPTTIEQERASCKLLEWLQSEYRISPKNVVDYGWTAFPPGRRKTSDKLPWQYWSAYGVCLHPTKRAGFDDHIDYDKLHRLSAQEHIEICAKTLRKLGFACPMTDEALNPEFQQYMTMFQKRYCPHRIGSSYSAETVAIMLALAAEHEKHDPRLKDIVPDLAPYIRKN